MTFFDDGGLLKDVVKKNSIMSVQHEQRQPTNLHLESCMTNTQIYLSNVPSLSIFV